MKPEILKILQVETGSFEMVIKVVVQEEGAQIPEDTQEPEPESRRGDYTKYATGQQIKSTHDIEIGLLKFFF